MIANILQIVLYYLFQFSLYFGVCFILSFIIHTACVFNPIRFIVGILMVGFSLVCFLNKEWELSLIVFLSSMLFLRDFYYYLNSNLAQVHKYHIKRTVELFLVPFKYLVNLGIQLTLYFVSIVNGVISEKKELESARLELKEEKKWVQSEREEMDREWERIKNAWGDLIRERAEFEQSQSGGYQREKKDYSKNKSYQESKSRSDTAEKRRKKEDQRQQKERTGRYFEEFASFNLDNFEKNNAYSVLGLSSGAGISDIKKAYRKLMIVYHPDKFRYEEDIEKLREAEKIAKLINWAKNRLN